MVNVLGMVILWIGSMLTSLWANVYEEVIRGLFKSANANTTGDETHLKKRVILLATESTFYIVIITLITPALLRMFLKKFKQWLNGINIQQLINNALDPARIPRI